MPKFNQLNVDVLLEITYHLRNVDRLALAYSHSKAFRLSRTSTYWHPEAFTEANIIHPTFLPVRITSWLGYTGDDYRLGVRRLLASRQNWLSERPRATSFTRLKETGNGLIPVTGSRWAVVQYHSISDLHYGFIDMMTGRRADGLINGGEPLRRSDESYLPPVYSCGPNELLIGINDSSVSKAALNSPTFPYRRKVNLNASSSSRVPTEYKCHYRKYRVVFTESDIDENQVQATVTPLCLFDASPSTTQCVLRRSFCIFYANTESSLCIVDLSSGQLWVWQTGKAILWVEMIEDWLMVVTKAEAVEMMAIQLSKLHSSHPQCSDGSIYQLEAREGAGMVFEVQNTSFFQPPHRTTPDISIIRALPKVEEDTFLLISYNYFEYWATKFHISPCDGLYGLVEMCIPNHACRNFACRMKKKTDLENSLSNIIYQRNDHRGFSRFGQQIARRFSTKDHWCVDFQIIGHHAPEELHELDMSFVRDEDQKAMFGERVMKMNDCKTPRYIDGDTGMVLVLDTYRGDANYTIYWF
ncbi:hypothetical protein M408DRAFT_23587 [Serendipita vermifera MAFF 305830]|uniref:Uncharacterized protein n=1 Tax=Serendipita vermifera MAFF 305830 TaxID=933852 RepID=A0A0C3B8T6_SERVB|nr:hypothetical protein M408DRAFT_23587 [Serendipita vermifera MAFF 305830]